MDVRNIFYVNLRKAMTERGITQNELASRIGVSSSTASDWCNGRKYPRPDKMQRIADLVHVPMSWLTTGTNQIPDGFEPLPELVTLPLAGDIACGDPILADENVEGYYQVPITMRADFMLRCKGDSMIDARIHDGDLAFIQKTPEVGDGEIAAVRIGDECTLKRVQRSGDILFLMPCNSSYQPMVFRGKEREEVHIEGKLVGFMSMNVK